MTTAEGGAAVHKLRGRIDEEKIYVFPFYFTYTF